jgi:hypothetical protein
MEAADSPTYRLLNKKATKQQVVELKYRQRLLKATGLKEMELGG